MADLSVTIGIDMKELEAGLANAGRKLGGLARQAHAGENPFQDTANKLSTAQGIGGVIAGPLGSLIGAFIGAFGELIGSLLSKIKELADYAQQIRRISLTTGLSIDDIRKFEAIGQAFGIGIESMSRAMVEFTKRMGEARIKGGEVPNLLAKMGVGMDEIAKGSFDATSAMKKLAEAYAAGTDEATLLYYGTRLFGDSFKDLLPIIKAGSKAIDEASDTYLKAREDATGALGRLGQDLDNVWRSIKNFFINLIGSVVEVIERAIARVKNMATWGYWNPFETAEDKAKRVIKNAPKYMTNEEIIKFALDNYYDEAERASAEKELRKQLAGTGKKLTPFGLSEAGAASNLQQMGGGDIFGAVAFTPLERIATATEQTAINTAPKDEAAPRPADTTAR